MGPEVETCLSQTAFSEPILETLPPSPRGTLGLLPVPTALMAASLLPACACAPSPCPTGAPTKETEKLAFRTHWDVSQPCEDSWDSLPSVLHGPNLGLSPQFLALRLAPYRCNECVYIRTKFRLHRGLGCLEHPLLLPSSL